MAAVVHHRTYPLLDRCLSSVARQECPATATLVLDAAGDDEERLSLARRHPRVGWIPAPNRGFSAGANGLLARPECRRAQAVLLLNADVELTPGFAATLLDALRTRASVAMVSGKLLRPDGVTIDSAGIVMPRNRRPQDRGSGEVDRGQYDRLETVFGLSGAALMIRTEALPDLAVDGELFDEDFFAYHEDTDLAWRAGLLGWRSLYVPQAIATHHRGWRPERPEGVSDELRRHSFKNHYLQMIKNERPLPFLRDLPVIMGWEVLRLGSALGRDRALLPAYGRALKLAGRAWRKRRGIQRRARQRAGQRD